MECDKFSFNDAALLLKKYFGDFPQQVHIYTNCDYVSESEKSRIIKAHVVYEGVIVSIGTWRVDGCAMGVDFYIIESIFRIAYPSLRYQDYLKHSWL